MEGSPQAAVSTWRAARRGWASEACGLPLRCRVALHPLGQPDAGMVAASGQCATGISATHSTGRVVRLWPLFSQTIGLNGDNSQYDRSHPCE